MCLMTPVIIQESQKACLACFHHQWKHVKSIRLIKQNGQLTEACLSLQSAAMWGHSQPALDDRVWCRARPSRGINTRTHIRLCLQPVLLPDRRRVRSYSITYKKYLLSCSQPDCSSALPSDRRYNRFMDCNVDQTGAWREMYLTSWM